MRGSNGESQGTKSIDTSSGLGEEERILDKENGYEINIHGMFVGDESGVGDKVSPSREFNCIGTAVGERNSFNHQTTYSFVNCVY